MKKIAVIAWIFSTILLIFPLASFADGVSERSEVENELLIAVYEDLEAEIPILGKVSVETTTLLIWWTGTQNKVVTPSDNHNHHAKVESASGYVMMEGVTSSIYGPIPVPIIILIIIESGEMNEHGVGEESDKTTVDIFFRVKSAVMDVISPPLIPGPIDLGKCMLKIQDGQIKFLRSENLAPSGRGKARVTTFGRIKSER